jgi:hypothetical protein
MDSKVILKDRMEAPGFVPMSWSSDITPGSTPPLLLVEEPVDYLQLLFWQNAGIK